MLYSNEQGTESRVQRTEGREQKAEGRGQKSEVREQKSEVREQKSEVREQKAENREQSYEVVMQINSARDLNVYKAAYSMAMEIFHLTKGFPAEERYALTSQIRRSSRSICLNLREAWAKRRYEAHFVSKLTDCDGENGETDSSLDFAKDCGYIIKRQHAELTASCAEIGKMLGTMIKNPAPFLTSAR